MPPCPDSAATEKGNDFELVPIGQLGLLVLGTTNELFVAFHRDLLGPQLQLPQQIRNRRRSGQGPRLTVDSH